MPNFAMYGLAADAAHARAQAMQTFGANGNKATPRSTGQTECDTDGLAIMGRKASGGAGGTASVSTSNDTALAENLKRVEAIFQNVDENGGILRIWSVEQPSRKFVVMPTGTFIWRGGDELRVDTAIGTADWIAVER